MGQEYGRAPIIGGRRHLLIMNRIILVLKLYPKAGWQKACSLKNISVKLSKQKLNESQPREVPVAATG
jgi:hypothetical protein